MHGFVERGVSQIGRSEHEGAGASAGVEIEDMFRAEHNQDLHKCSVRNVVNTQA